MGQQDYCKITNKNFRYLVSRKFFKKQLSDGEENINKENISEIIQEKDKNINNNQIYSTKKRSKNKKRKFINKEDENYYPDNEDSSEFSSIKLKKTKEITKTFNSEINSNYEFKISNPINFELGIGSNSGKFEINDNQMIRFSREKNIRRKDKNFNVANEAFKKENEENEHFESDKKIEIKINNTREMNKMLNLHKNKLKEYKFLCIKFKNNLLGA